MSLQTVFHGTKAESAALVQAIGRNCGCQVDGRIIRQQCGPHKMLIDDQRALDGLIFMRRMAQSLKRQEWRE